MSIRQSPSVTVIGAGPAGLMAADVLSRAGIDVAVYDAMPSAGRKFLMAGKGGMNITHAEPFEAFLSRYGARRVELEPMLRAFAPDALRNWVLELGLETFVGSSGRVFPTDMKAAPLLRAWLHRLRVAGVRLCMRHRWLGWSDDGSLLFAAADGERRIRADAVLLALGGGSWPQLGSTGAWVPLLQQCGVAVAPLLPANCGFECNWSPYLRQRFAGHPLKPVKLGFCAEDGSNYQQQGELIVTVHGLEGGPIYALSAPLRTAIITGGEARITLDLLPDRTLPDVLERLSAPQGKESMVNRLRKRVGVDGLKAALLREVLTAADMNDAALVATTLKALPIRLTAPRPLTEAISSAGGVRFDGLNRNLMLNVLPGVFVAGEMLDWEAPTGGYLLSACFATGLHAGLGIRDWLRCRAEA